MKRLPSWFVIAVAVAAAVGAVFVTLLLVPVWLNPPLSRADLEGIQDPERRVTLQQAQAQLQNETRTTLLQGFAGLVLVAGAFATWRQVQISRHGQITERINKAVEQLTGSRMDVRVAGIYALERVASNSLEDRNTVTSILTNFIRAQVPWAAPQTAAHQHPPVPENDRPPWAGTRAGDVQVALYAIARRPQPYKGWKPFLSFSDLSHARMGNRDWRDLICQHSNLTRVWMPNARLDNAKLNGTDLRHAHLVGARLTNAKLSGAHLQGANLRDADLRGADLTDTCLDQADLTGTHHDQNTHWPDGFTPP